MSRRFQFMLWALLVAALVADAFFGMMAFFFYRDVEELRLTLEVEKRNNAKTEQVLRDTMRDLIEARERIPELENR